MIELDLEKFFDRVNHDKLMSRVARKVKDKRVLKIIRAYLNSGAMLNGVKVETKEGTPQGSPLSPILANIMLDDLDKELERRGHKFCRYADDITIYVKSERAARRVKESITGYIEKKLKLKVNKEKSTVDRPWKTKFLGFTFYQKEGEWYPSIAKESIQKLKRKIKKITSRRKPTSTQERIEQINKITRGWINYFSIAKAKSKIEEIDGWIRRRLRMCEWKLWKRIRTRLRKLMELGIEATRKNVCQYPERILAYSRKPNPDNDIDKQVFRGNRLQEPTHAVRGSASQLRNRPYTGRYVRWCERTLGKLPNYPAPTRLFIGFKVFIKPLNDFFESSQSVQWFSCSA